MEAVFFAGTALAIGIVIFLIDLWRDRQTKDGREFKRLSEKYSVDWVRDEVMDDVKQALWYLEQGEVSQARFLLNRALR